MSASVGPESCRVPLKPGRLYITATAPSAVGLWIRGAGAGEVDGLLDDRGEAPPRAGALVSDLDVAGRLELGGPVLVEGCGEGAAGAGQRRGWNDRGGAPARRRVGRGRRGGGLRTGGRDHAHDRRRDQK